MTEVLFIYTLFAYGLTNVIVFGAGPFDIISKFREKLEGTTFGDMVSCPMCLSTNIGWVISLFNILFLSDIPFTPFNVMFNDTSLWYLIIPLDMFYTSGCVWIIHTLQETLESITNKNSK